MISKTDASGSWSYTWDSENRLKQASKSGGVTVTYSFDALGRRVQRTSSANGTEKFVYDGVDVIRDLNGNNATVADYLNGPGIDNKLRQTISSTASYFLADHLGTTRALADASGSTTSSIQYDAFGNVTNGSLPSRYTYTSREIESDIDLMYYRARWYDPHQGRFVSEDPIGLSAGAHFYAYVNNSPATLTDPSGLCPRSLGPVKSSACARFVKHLVQWVKDGWLIDIANIGRSMGAAAQYMRDRKNDSVDRFRSELVSPYQLGDVYRHILGVAGATLVGSARLYVISGPSGYDIINDRNRQDRAQLMDPDLRRRLEAEVELRDNDAGYLIGLYQRAYLGGEIDLNELRKRIFQILCRY